MSGLSQTEKVGLKFNKMCDMILIYFPLKRVCLAGIWHMYFGKMLFGFYTCMYDAQLCDLIVKAS